MSKLLVLCLVLLCSQVYAAKPLSPDEDPYLFQVLVYKNGELVGSNIPWHVKGNRYMTYQESIHHLVNDLKRISGFVKAGDCFKILVTWPRDGYDPFWVYTKTDENALLGTITPNKIPECEGGV